MPDDTTSQPDAGATTGGQPVDRLAAPGRYRSRELVIVDAILWTGENEDAIREFAAGQWGGSVPLGCYVVKSATGNFFTVDAERFAAIYEPAGTDPETPLSDAQHAIGQIIRLAESWQMQEGHLDAPHAAVALLDICAPWTGMPVRELEAIGTGPLLDPDCRDGKHASCVGGLCECEHHKQSGADRA